MYRCFSTIGYIFRLHKRSLPAEKMGADGGTIPTRDELVKTKKNPENKDKDSVRLYKWQYCHLTQEKIVRPIVACQLGRLYNKEAIIKILLQKKNHCDQQEYVVDSTIVNHIRNLKDVRELNLTNNPAFDSHKSGPPAGDGVYVDRHTSTFICPIAGLEMNGSYPFLFDWTNGNVMSERGYKIVRDDTTVSIDEENIVFLNPDENSTQAKLMVIKMNARRTKAKMLKRCAKDQTKNDSEKGSCESKKTKVTFS